MSDKRSNDNYPMILMSVDRYINHGTNLTMRTINYCNESRGSKSQPWDESNHRTEDDKDEDK